MKTLSNKTTLLLADMTLFIVAAIWGGGFVAGKYALKGLGPLAILMYRFCGAAIIMGLIFNRRIRLAERGIIKYGLLLGVLQFLGLLIHLFGLQYTTPAKQSFLAATYVIFTPLAAWAITKARPLKKDGLAAFIAVLGIALISLNGDLGIQLGDPVTLLFALVFSIQIVLTGRYAKSLDPIALTFYQFSFSGLLSIICVIFSGTKIVCTDRGSLYGVTYLVFINTASTHLPGRIRFEVCQRQPHSIDSVTGVCLRLSLFCAYFQRDGNDEDYSWMHSDSGGSDYIPRTFASSVTSSLPKTCLAHRQSSSAA